MENLNVIPAFAGMTTIYEGITYGYAGSISCRDSLQK
jgi:hypothetical protein